MNSNGNSNKKRNILVTIYELLEVVGVVVGVGGQGVGGGGGVAQSGESAGGLKIMF